MIDFIETDELKLKDGETEEEYELRICGMHDDMSLTWDEIASIINSALGYNYTESRYRRLYKAYCLGLKRATKAVENQADASENQNEEINSQENKVEEPEYSEEETELRLKYAGSAERLAFLRETRQDSRFERFYKNIADAILRCGKLEEPALLRPLPEDRNDEEYVVPIADMHLGAKFKSVNNEYSIDIAKQRLDLAASEIISFITEKDLRKITVLSLGDMIQGMLRVSDLKLNEAEVVNAFVIACRLIAGFLNKLSQYCEVDYIHVCYSNHEQPRYLGTKASELAGEDMGKISFAYIQDVLANNSRVHVYGDTQKDYYEFNIFDFKCFASHGHQVKDLKNVTKDLANRHRTFYDYVFLAHSHSAKEFITGEDGNHDVEVLVAPSIIGSDPYADSLMVGSKAAIKIFGFNKTYGHNESYKFILN